MHGEGDRIHQRGILYAPDYVINAGGIINICTEYLDDGDASVVRGRIEGVLLDRRSARGFVADARTSMHLRHWHKYQSAELPHHQRFFFCRRDRLTGAVAASMADFHHEIGRAEPQSLPGTEIKQIEGDQQAA